MLGVYIHIPFCEKKCNYCAFSSFSGREREIDKYISSLTKEISSFKDKNGLQKIDTIYIGGGTPSILTPLQIERIFESLKSNFLIEENCEITIECNPNSLNKEKLESYKKEGVNRLSIGVQSLDDNDLKFIGRLHNSEKALASIRLAKECGFENISVDLLIGLKNSNVDNFISQLEVLINEDIQHISTYMLQIEENTPLEKMVKENADLLPSDDESVEIYNESAKFLQKRGFLRYEVSNFAKNGYESRHNLKYWSGENYIGFGLSAHSYMNGVRFANSNNFEDYYSRKLSLKEVLTKEQLIEEHIMLGLRCKNGIDIKFLKDLNYDIEKNQYLNEFIERGILKRTENKIFINPEYYGINNFIIVHLLPNDWKNSMYQHIEFFFTCKKFYEL